MAVPGIRTIFPVVSGVIAALATTAWLNRHHGEHTPPGVAAEATQPTAEKKGERKETTHVVTRYADNARIERLEAELAQLKQEAAKPTAKPDLQVEEMPREERLKLIAERVASLDRAYEQDPKDPKWAPQAARSLNSGLQGLAQKFGFSVLAADCKTELCRARVEFPNYEEARKKGHHLAEHSLPGLACAQSIHSLPPTTPNAPYQTQLFLNCSKFRTGEVEASSNEGN